MAGQTPTAAQLDAWQALCDGATPGPWEPTVMGGVLDADFCSIAFEHSEEGIAPGFRDSDASFIAEARFAMPILIAEVRRLQAEAAQFQFHAPSLQEMGFDRIYVHKRAPGEDIEIETPCDECGAPYGDHLMPGKGCPRKAMQA